MSLERRQIYCDNSIEAKQLNQKTPANYYQAFPYQRKIGSTRPNMPSKAKKYAISVMIFSKNPYPPHSQRSYAKLAPVVPDTVDKDYSWSCPKQHTPYSSTICHEQVSTRKFESVVVNHFQILLKENNQTLLVVGEKNDSNKQI